MVKLAKTTTHHQKLSVVCSDMVSQTFHLKQSCELQLNICLLPFAGGSVGSSDAAWHSRQIVVIFLHFDLPA
eukprot:3997873-Amphidinium_carterae.1